MSTRRCQEPGVGKTHLRGSSPDFCPARHVSSPRYCGHSHHPTARAASLGSPGTLSLRSTFYPCRLQGRTPHSLFATRRVWEAQGKGPHLTLGQPSCPGIAPGPRTRSCGALPTFACLAGYEATCALFFSTAPAGGVPVFRYFHSSIRSFRASATIPILRSRVLPRPYRSWYHRLRSLSGW